jgi:hypothetical protein
LSSFDEARLLGRLASATPRTRALFAALIAERLFGLYELFAQRSGKGDPVALRAALDAAWDAADAAELTRAQALAEALVPDEGEHWVLESGFGSNAAAAVAYALRTRLTDDPQEAAWAARQAYDVADYAAQLQLDDDGFDEDALADQPVVQEALAGIDADLETALSDPPAEAIPRLRQARRAAAARLAELAA